MCARRRSNFLLSRQEGVEKTKYNPAALIAQEQCDGKDRPTTRNRAGRLRGAARGGQRQPAGDAARTGAGMGRSNGPQCPQHCDHAGGSEGCWLATDTAQGPALACATPASRQALRLQRPTSAQLLARHCRRPDRRRMGAGPGFVRARTWLARQACDLLAAQHRRRLLLRAAHRLVLAQPAGADLPSLAVRSEGLRGVGSPRQVRGTAGASAWSAQPSPAKPSSIRSPIGAARRVESWASMRARRCRGASAIW